MFRTVLVGSECICSSVKLAAAARGYLLSSRTVSLISCKSVLLRGKLSAVLSAYSRVFFIPVLHVNQNSII